MIGEIFQFLAPILQATLGAAAGQGVNALMAPGQDRGERRPQQAGPSPMGSPASAVGQGQATAPSGLNFSGGFTGGSPIQPQQGPQQGQPGMSSGFTTLGYPVTDQSKMRRAINDQGFQAI